MIRPKLRPRVTLVVASALVPVLGAASPYEPGGDPAASDAHACKADESWDNAMSMCMPSASSAGAHTAVSGQFNIFGVFDVAQGPRGVDQFAAPNMFMLDVGRAITTRQFLDLNLMGTSELWTYPQRGYPQLLQIGEERSDGQPYFDAQHPHTSPIMGLTLSDTVSLESSKTLKLFFGPRGESTDGPIAFMHRDSARDDPDAPLGHHVGQDVGHISSTVLGGQLNLGQVIVEVSAFNGTEPNPTVVDLPLGSLNSEALRVTYLWTLADRVMASIANVKQTDPQYPGTTSATRLSASLYDQALLAEVGSLDHTLVVGSITRHPTDSPLTSFLDEAVLQRGASDLWWRIEVLQRLASELEIPTSPLPATSIEVKHWVSALTLGYTHWSLRYRKLQVGVGSSLTMDVVPSDWARIYGSRTPLTLRFIVQVRGSGRWQP
jgi:hypothetical protein